MNTAPAEPSARGVHLFGAGPFTFPARPLSKSAPGTLPVLAPAAESGPSPPGGLGLPPDAAHQARRGAVWRAVRRAGVLTAALARGATRGHTRALCGEHLCGPIGGADLSRALALELPTAGGTRRPEPGKAAIRLRLARPRRRAEPRGTPWRRRGAWPLSTISGHRRPLGHPPRRRRARASERPRPCSLPWAATRPRPSQVDSQEPQQAAEEHGQPGARLARHRRNRRLPRALRRVRPRRRPRPQRDHA